MMAESKKAPEGLPHFRELDGIRGLAALGVFFHHVVYTSYPAPTSPFRNWFTYILYAGSAHGDAGVDLFFVLSGFLITSLLLKDRGSSSYYRDFYWKRALRILPLYLLCLLGLLLAIPHSGGFVLLSLAFLANVAYLLHIPSLGPFWSLAIEEQFYIAWPTLVRHRTLRDLTRVALGLVIGVTLLRILSAVGGHHNYQLTPYRLDGLGAGALLACRRVSLGHIGKTLAVDRGLLLTAAALSVPLFLCNYLPGIGSLAAMHAATLASANTLLFTAIIGLAIAFSGHRVLAPLRSAPLFFFGLISYAFYMLHAYVMQLYDRFAAPAPFGTPAFFLRIVAVLALTLVACLLSRYLLELPALSLRRFVLHRPAPPPEIAQPLISKV